MIKGIHKTCDFSKLHLSSYGWIPQVATECDNASISISELHMYNFSVKSNTTELSQWETQHLRRSNYDHQLPIDDSWCALSSVLYHGWYNRLEQTITGIMSRQCSTLSKHEDPHHNLRSTYRHPTRWLVGCEIESRSVDCWHESRPPTMKSLNQNSILLCLTTVH